MYKSSVASRHLPAFNNTPTASTRDEGIIAFRAQMIATAVLKGKADAPYVLNAQLVSLHQPFAGFEITVTSTVQYQLFAAEQTTPVLNETVVTPYTANFSDALYGPERLRLANEGAMRENIHEIISRIITAAKPGGVLSNPSTAKVSSLQ